MSKKTNPNYRPGIDPPSYRKDTHLKLGEPNPKDLGTDGYEYEEDILEDSRNFVLLPKRRKNKWQ